MISPLLKQGVSDRKGQGFPGTGIELVDWLISGPDPKACKFSDYVCYRPADPKIKGKREPLWKIWVAQGPDLAKQELDKALICPDLTDPDTLATYRTPSQIDSQAAETDSIQIFIKTLGRKHICWKLRKGMRIQDLVYEIQIHLGILANSQNLIH